MQNKYKFNKVLQALNAGIQQDDVTIVQYNNKEVRVWDKDEVHCDGKCIMLNNADSEMEVAQAIIDITV